MDYNSHIAANLVDYFIKYFVVKFNGICDITRKTRSDKILEPKCKLCSFETNNNANMLVHVLTKHSTPERRKKEFKFYCEKCDFGTFTQLEVCEIFNCSARSLMRWVSKYQNDDGSIERYNRTPVAYKVTKEHVKFSRRFKCLKV